MSEKNIIRSKKNLNKREINVREKEREREGGREGTSVEESRETDQFYLWSVF